MKKTTGFVLMALLISSSASASIVINSVGDSYSQNFDSAPIPTSNRDAWTWTDNSTFAGWYRRSNVNNDTQTLDPDLADYTAKGAGVTIDGFYNAHAGTSTDAAVGFFVDGQSGGLKKGSVGMVFQNNTGTTLSGFDVAYKGEKWYQHTADTTLLFQYTVQDSFADINSDIDRAGAGIWTDVGALSWTETAAAGTGWVNGSTAANGTNFNASVSGLSLADGQSLILRWRIPLTGTKEQGLFIDDVTVDNFQVIPEPATLGLIAAFGTSVLFIRRLMM
jgi:hypothetical protein